MYRTDDVFVCTEQMMYICVYGKVDVFMYENDNEFLSTGQMMYICVRKRR